MLSTKRHNDQSVPVALDLNKSDPDIIYYTKSAPADDSDSDWDELSDDDLAREYGKTATRVQKNIPSLEKEFRRGVRSGKIRYGKYKCKQGTIVPYPDHDERVPRTTCHIFGTQGAGKTTRVIADVNIIRKERGKKVYVINGKPDEKRFKQNGFKELDIDTLVEPAQSQQKYEEAKLRFKMLDKSQLDPEEVIEMKLALNALKPRKVQNYSLTPFFHKISPNSVFIFDDFGADKELKSKCLHVLTYILANCRSIQTDCYVLTHLPSWGTDTREMHNHIMIYVMFDRTSKRYNNFLMKEYLGFNAKQCNQVNRMLSRSDWVAINKHKNCAISPHQVCLL